MEVLNLDINKRYSYADYLTWMDDVRRELFDGIVKIMSPSPSSTHQIISGNLYRSFANFLFRKQCRVFYAPSDVRLSKDKNINDDKHTYTVVQPDIFVVCDAAKIDFKGCLGSPDFIIEIVSPKNSKRDVKDKFHIYEEHGVREYWIVNPSDENVNVFILDDNGKFKLIGIFSEDDKIPVHIFNGELEIDLLEIFEL